MSRFLDSHFPLKCDVICGQPLSAEFVKLCPGDRSIISDKNSALTF